MREITTTKFEDFCLNDLVKLLTAWRDQGLPDDFYDQNVHPMQNNNSGCLFLTNDDLQVAMLNGDNLESWYYCPECGHEGFSDECQLNDRGCNECNPEESEDEDNG